MGLFLGWSCEWLCAAFLRCAGHHRRVGLSVRRGATVCRNGRPGVRSLRRQLLLRTRRFAFASLPGAGSAAQPAQPGRPASPLVLRAVCRSLALPAARLAAEAVLILCGREVFSGASWSLSVGLLVGQSFGSSGLRVFD